MHPLESNVDHFKLMQVCKSKISVRGHCAQVHFKKRCGLAGGKRGRLVAAIVPEPGLALLHMHGDDCLEHEGAEVLSGVKYVLRSDILY